MTAGTDALIQAFRLWVTDKVPASGANWPNKAEIIAGLTRLAVDIGAAQAGVHIEPTTAARDTYYATTANRGNLVYVNNNNGSATDPANGVYEYVSGAPRLAQGFYAGVATVVEPLVAQASDYADAAAASAQDAADVTAEITPTVNALDDIVTVSTVTVGGTFTTDSTFGPGAAGALIGQVTADCRFEQIVLPIVAAGNLNLLRVRNVSGANYETIEKKAVTAPTAGANNTITVAGWDFEAGDYIGYESVGTGSATVSYSASASGYTAVGIAAAVTIGTQAWTNFASRRFGGVASFTARSVAVGSPELASELNARIAVGEAVGPIVSDAVATVGSAFTYNDVLGSGLAVLIGSAANAGQVSSVTIPVTTAGSIRLVHVRPVSGLSMTTLAKYTVTALTANADNTFTAADFGTINMQAGDYLGYETVSGGAVARWANAGDGTGYTATAIFSSPSGTQTWQQFSNRRWGGQFSTTRKVVQVTRDNTSSSLQRALSRPAVTFNQGMGNSAPAGWTFGGAWTHTAGGALSPAGAGDMSIYAKLSQASLFHDEDRAIRFWVQPQAATSKFACGTWRATHGTLVIVDGSANLFSFARSNTGSTGGGSDTTWASAPTILKSVALPALTAGRTYVVELRKNRRINTATVRDMVTGAIIATISDGSNDGVIIPASAYQFGSPFFAAMSGATLLVRATANSGRKTPRVMMIGDSITEAPYDSGVQLPQRWGQIVKDALGGNAVIAGLSGSKADEIAPLLLNEIPAIKPEWIISSFGTNDMDSGLATFQTNMNNLVSYCSANGVNLAVAKIQPIPSRTFTNLNAFIDTLPQWVRRIRMDLALTTGNDGTTFNAANYGTDQLHPNATGHALMAARVAVDLPEIYDLAA